MKSNVIQQAQFRNNFVDSEIWHSSAEIWHSYAEIWHSCDEMWYSNSTTLLIRGAVYLDLVSMWPSGNTLICIGHC